MKKSVVIVIGFIYAFSIIIVTIFGLKPSIANDTVYVQQIEIIEPNAKFMENGTKYINIYVGEDGTAQYQLNWKVTPDNATNADVSINYDTQNKNVSIDENGLVTFVSSGRNESVNVYIKPADGTLVSDSILLRFRHIKNN